MKHRLRAVALPALLVFAVACASVTSGDPVVVRAEQSVNVAFETIDTFLYIEKYHGTELAAVGADVHSVAEVLRSNAPNAFRKARRLIDAYKNARTDAGKADMFTAVAFVQALADEVMPYLARYEAAKGGA